jgi:hypothetical protein
VDANTKKIVAIVLIALGAVLLYFGLQATDAPVEQVRESITGDYSDRTMWYLIGGAVAVVAGVGLLFFRR